MYTFECKKCEKVHELDIKMSEYKAEQECPECKELMERVFGATNSVWKCGGIFGKSK